MRVKIVAIVLGVFGFVQLLQGQASLEHTFIGEYPEIVEIEDEGFFYLIEDKDNNTFSLYNWDYSIFKTITVPIPSFYTVNTVYIISQISNRLFNGDPKIEFVVFYSRAGGPGEPSYRRIDLINEDGVVLQEFFDGERDPAVREPILISDGSEFKMMIEINEEVNVYSLPGSIPCTPCSGSNPNGIALNNLSGGFTQNPFPNPATEFINLTYKLPVGVNTANLKVYDLKGKLRQEFTVDGAFEFIRLKTTDLESGQYIYIVESEGEQISSHKIMVSRN